MTTGTSGGTFVEIACLYDKDLSRFSCEQLGSELLMSGDFTFDLMCKSHLLPISRCKNLRPLELRFLGTEAVCIMPKYP